MMKTISIFLLIIAAGTTAVAGEDRTVIANLENGTAIRQRNSALPPVVKETYEYYEVCGCCEKEVQNELKKKCVTWTDGKKYDSVTKWKVSWDYGHSRGPDVCTADAFTVTVDVVYHLPKWVRTDDAPVKLVEKWDAYREKLILHEKGHRDRTVEAADQLASTVAELPPARTCDELDRAIHTLCRKQMNQLTREQEEYDTTTKHGATQGAVFP